MEQKRKRQKRHLDDRSGKGKDRKKKQKTEKENKKTENKTEDRRRRQKTDKETRRQKKKKKTEKEIRRQKIIKKDRKQKKRTEDGRWFSIILMLYLNYISQSDRYIIRSNVYSFHDCPTATFSRPFVLITSSAQNYPFHDFHEQGYTSIIHYTHRSYNHIFQILKRKESIEKNKEQTLCKNLDIIYF